MSRAAGAAITQPRVGRGAAWGDFDNDGRPDLLLVPNTGPAALLRNDSEGGNHWLTLRLAGTRSNRDGLGASVRVRAGSATRVGYLHSGSSYLSASGLRLHFGLGTARQADEIEIRWPNGKRELLRDVPGDRIYRIVEGSGRAEPLPAGPGRK